jgi:outer membrane protein assembly factor BamE (lipoprotein component of BamABCDE complex)
MSPVRTVQAPVRLIKAGLIAAALLAGATACSPVVGRHGFQVTDVNPKDVKVGEDTKSTVLSKLGSPSTVSTFEPNVWYYISQTTERRTYHKPAVEDRNVTVIAFDKASEKVTEVKALTLNDSRRIAYNDRETPTRGRELTALEQLLGNVGRGGMLPRSDDERTPGGRRPD